MDKEISPEHNSPDPEDGRFIRMSDGGVAEFTPEGIQKYQDSKSVDSEYDAPLDAKHIAIGAFVAGTTVLGIAAIAKHRLSKRKEK